MATNPNNLGPKVSSRNLNWLDLVTRSWGSEFRAPDHGIYQFDGGRKFDSTDKGKTGLYGVDAPELLVLDGGQYPDMRDGVFQETSGVAQLGQVVPAGLFNELAIEDNSPLANLNDPYPYTPAAAAASAICYWGAAWTSRTITSSTWTGVAVGNGIAVIVGGVTTTNLVRYSTDLGVTWKTAATPPAFTGSNPPNSVAFVNGQFVATTLTGTQVAYSTDGNIWTTVTTKPNNASSAVFFGNGIYVLVNGAAGNTTQTSPDAITWTNRTLSASGALQAGVYSPGNTNKYIQIGSSTTQVSPDSVTWSAGAAHAAGTWAIAANTTGTVVAVNQSANSTTTGVIYSTDGGVTWNAATTPTSIGLGSIMFAQGVFVVTTLTTNQILLSLDGIGWYLSPNTMPAAHMIVANAGTQYAGVVTGSTTTQAGSGVC